MWYSFVSQKQLNKTMKIFIMDSSIIEWRWKHWGKREIAYYERFRRLPHCSDWCHPLYMRQNTWEEWTRYINIFSLPLHVTVFGRIKSKNKSVKVYFDPSKSAVLALSNYLWTKSFKICIYYLCIYFKRQVMVHCRIYEKQLFIYLKTKDVVICYTTLGTTLHCISTLLVHASLTNLL